MDANFDGKLKLSKLSKALKNMKKVEYLGTLEKLATNIMQPKRDIYVNSVLFSQFNKFSLTSSLTCYIWTLDDKIRRL